MKTIHTYEASDIDVTGNPVHRFLMVMVVATAMTFRPKEEDDPIDYTNGHVARILNEAARAGVSIAVAEPVPEVFR